MIGFINDLKDDVSEKIEKEKYFSYLNGDPTKFKPEEVLKRKKNR